jgi:restriction system protein
MKGGKDPGLQLFVEEPEIRGDETNQKGEPLTNLAELARDQIRMRLEGKFKGHELANLVNAVLEAQGYSTFKSSPGPDGGIDILAGKGSLGFDHPRLCVQVKSGSSASDVRAIRELEGVMGRVGADQGLFVSWGGFTDAVYKEHRNTYFKVRFWDSNDLIDAIFDEYEKLPEEIQTELTLKRIWVIVPEER